MKTANRPIIEVQSLSKRYRLGAIGVTSLREEAAAWLHRLRTGAGKADRKDFWALRDVSFSVQRGEVIGIIGRNGAGKSTLLKILSRITEPTSGRAFLRGRVASLLEVGTGFHPDLTGRENVFLNGAILGMSRAETAGKFDEIVAFAEVDRFIDTPVKKYSSGMYVRLAFAIAAHLEPEILIVDEVLAVGDAQFQSKCLGKMESIAQHHARTIFFVSHNMAAVARFCPRVLLLEDGRVVADGRSDSAIDRYLDTHNPRSGAVVDLPADGAVPGAPLTLTALMLNGGKPIASRGPFTASLRFVAHRPIAAVGFGLGMCGLDGRRIITLESDYDHRFFQVASAGEHRVDFTLPVVDLAPGRYRIDIVAFGSMHESFYHAVDCASVDVAPGSGTPLHLQGAYGDYRPASRWQLGRD